MRAVNGTVAAVRHSLAALAEGALIVGIVAAIAIAVGVLTGHPGGASALMAKGTSDYSITVSGTTAAPVSFTYGSTVATYSTYGKADPLYVRVLCTANSSTQTTLAIGATVYDVYKVIKQGTWNTSGYAAFDTSTSPAWTGGGADCTAFLRTYVMHNADRVWKTLASAAFTVNP